MEALEQACKLLNEMLKLDPDFTQTIVSYRIECNKQLAEHPTIQVKDNGQEHYTAGLLGVINGLAPKATSAIAAVYNDNNKIIKFEVMDFEEEDARSSSGS
jgi:hypothetical protein